MKTEYDSAYVAGKQDTGSRLSETDDYKRDCLIRAIEHSVEGMTLKELEALSYDMFTKGYMDYPEV